MIENGEQIKQELERVVEAQVTELRQKLVTLSKGNLTRIIKVYSGVMGQGVKLQPIEKQFIDRMVSTQENLLALAGLADELKSDTKEQKDV